jgi:hypothetical protein
MIILDEELLKNSQNFIDIVEDEKININNTLKSQQQLKELLLNYMQKIVDCTEKNIDESYVNSFLSFLEGLKKLLNYCNENISYINNLLDTLNKLLLESKQDNVNLNSEILNDINLKYKETSNIVSKNTLEINTFLNSILPFSELKFIKSNEEKNKTNLEEEQTKTEKNETNLDKEQIKTEKIEKNISKVSSSKNITSGEKFEVSEKSNNPDATNSKYTENTLIVSETKGKVFLPYTLSDLNELLEKHPQTFLDIDDVIAKNFTLPLTSFKDLSIARFREAFKLMKRKEKSSIKDAFELGMELLFNYNLHPAIISACKNLDELDIYLDYLDSNETDKFDCFKIIFEMAPVLSKKNQKSLTTL